MTVTAEGSSIWEVAKELDRLAAGRPEYAALHAAMTESQHGAKFIAWRDDVLAGRDTRLAAGRHLLTGLEDLHHIPNGGKRDKLTALKLKAEGVTPGVPDYFLPVPMRGYHGFYLELKRPGGRPTPEQVSWLERAQGRGYAAAICTGYMQACAAVLAYYLGAKPFEARAEA